jgi:Family of unknown function (DUF6527)
MKWLRNLWNRFWRWVRRAPVPLRTVFVEELPDDLESKSVYLVGEGSYLWFAAMLCPCGCGETLHMSLLPGGHPRWEVIRHDDGTVSVDPSVRRNKGCRSHFFLKKGIIVWCESSNLPTGAGRFFL